jgi:hypothetical protein
MEAGILKQKIFKKLNITEDKYEENPKYYIREALKTYKRGNQHLKDMVKEKNEKVQDLQFLERTMVSSVSFDGVAAGKNTGGRANGVLIKLESQLMLQEEIRNRILDIYLTEKALEEDNEITEAIISCIEKGDYETVMRDKYIKCYTNREIAEKYEYTIEWVRIVIFRSIKKIVQKMKV